LESGLPIKQLVARVAKKKAKKAKPKGYNKLSQKQKFIEAAKQFEADETGDTFLASFKAIASHKPVPNPRRQRKT
jgi:hypothetical protein